ncbi:CMGC/CDK/CRK7 protein kinase, partial [Pseudoloma neurophilia]
MNSNDNFSTEQESYEEEKTQDSSGYASNVDQKGSVQSSEGKRHRSVTQKNKFDTQQNESDTLKDDSPKPKKRHSSITDSYQIIRKIGAGTYGNVFLAQKDQKQFALKQVLRIGRRTGLPLSFLRELKTLSGITHPNIVNFIECKSNIVRNKIEIFMVFEYMPLDLHRYMTSKFIMEESIIENIAYQIFLAVQYLHSKNIIHRDIKPANILVSSDDDILKIKLADFGMSRTVPKEGEIDETCIEVMSSSSSDLNESKDESK